MVKRVNGKRIIKWTAIFCVTIGLIFCWIYKFHRNWFYAAYYSVNQNRAFEDEIVILSDEYNNAESIHLFACYGQSWANGYDEQAHTISQKYNNIMLESGIQNFYIMNMDVSSTRFVPLVEQNGFHSNEVFQQTGETPVSGQTNMVCQLLEEENGRGSGYNYILLGTAPGRGSTCIEQLSKGTDFYNRFLDVVENANRLAEADDKKLVVDAFSWAQGITKNDKDYCWQLEQLRKDLDFDVKKITGQEEDIKCITWQSFGYEENEVYKSHPYDRYVVASHLYDNIICSGATYNLDLINEGGGKLPLYRLWLGSARSLFWNRI